ncbi:hypothetical protein ACHAXR_009303 [Thalassiosira sp. AJA248-18]
MAGGYHVVGDWWLLEHVLLALLRCMLHVECEGLKVHFVLWSIAMRHKIINHQLRRIMSQSATSSTRPPLPPLPPLPIATTNDIRKSHGFSNTAHWVIPNILMQGGRPGVGLIDTETTTLLDQIRTIVNDAGCRTFVSLQAECVPEEGSILLDGGGGCRKDIPKDLPVYAKHVVSVTNGVLGGEEQEGSSSAAASPNFLYYGIIGMQTAKSIDSLSNAISDLAKRIREGETIYIHCGGGVGRAGLVAACLLGALYDDIDAEQALQYTNGFCQLRNLKGKEEEVHYSSPETDGQKEQVRDFFTKLRRKE